MIGTIARTWQCQRLYVVRRLYSAQCSGVAPSARPVVLIGHPALRSICEPCRGDDYYHDEALDKDKQALVATLEEFRRKNGFGRGIAAPQIGVLRRFLAINMGEHHVEENGASVANTTRVLSDPEITWRSQDTFTMYDDCMSLPWILCKVRRHQSISVQFYNEQRELEVWDQCSQPLSELLQHEMDHLDGKLIVDIVEGGGQGIIARDEFEKNPRLYEQEVDYFIQPTIGR